MIWRSPERVSVGEEGEGHSMQKSQDKKCAGTSSGKSGTRNLETEAEAEAGHKQNEKVEHKQNEKVEHR